MPDTARQPLPDTMLRNAQHQTEQLDDENAEAFSAVRSLLIGEELTELDTLRNRLDKVEQDEFDLDRRRDAVAEVLGDALKQASLRDGNKIEDVLNPTIGEGIRHQLKNERPAMVAALVPMVGTLVTGAVAEAIGKLSASINERVEKLFSLDGLKLGIKAKLTGQSVSDLLLAELRQTEMERLYLFERATEKLVFCWPEPEDGDALSEGMAEEILRGVLTFSSGILDTGDHGLRSIAIKDRHLVLQASDTYIVVIELSGPLSDERRGAMNDACFDVLNFVSDLTGDLADVEIDEEAMGLFAARIARSEKSGSHKAGGRRLSASACLAAVIALLLLGYFGWRAYDGYQISTRAEAIETHIKSSFPSDSLMLSVTPDRASGTIAVMGVALSDGDRMAIREQATALAQPYALAFNLVNGDPDRAAPRLSAIENDLNALRAQDSALDTALRDVNAKAALARARADALWAAQRQLEHWVASHAVFFSVGAKYSAPEKTKSDLDALATLLKNAPERPLRIIGYSDLIGSDSDNLPLAQRRGQKIAADLMARGIPADRLIVLGRTGQENIISTENGPNSPNRRVEFALGFVGEGL